MQGARYYGIDPVVCVRRAQVRGNAMSYMLTLILTTGALFAGMVALLETGRRIGMARLQQKGDAGKGLGAVEGAVYGLLGLLIAFTFSGAAARFEARRHLLVEEANAIGTAYLRLEFYRKIQDPEAARQSFDESVELQGRIWTEAVTASRTAPMQQAPMLLLPALNQMIDITTTRLVALKVHPPSIIFLMLAGLSLVSALLAGYGMAESKTHSWLHIVLYAAVLSFIIFVILDLEYPRWGLIRIDAADELLVSVRQSMK